MNPFSAIVSLIANGLSVAATWMGKYSADKPTEARRIEAENARIEELRKAMRENDIEAVRRILGGRPPAR